MGFGKKKKDAAEVLGRLSVMPWDQEPLTEVQPLRENESDFEERGTVKGAGKQDTK